MRQIQVGDLRIGRDEKNIINDVLRNGRISEYKKVKQFEEDFAKYIGTKYSIAVNSGTSALIAGLLALQNHKKLKIKLGTKIVTSPLTYIATSNAIMLSGFKPEYVDVDPETFVITPENIKTHLEQADNSSDYSVLLPVHLMGFACDMKEINKIAKKYSLVTFEDSAQAHGTIINGKKTGSQSLLSDFSFYIAHNIQAGELGAITTDDYEIIRLVKKIKANGRFCDCPTCTRNTHGCPKMKSYKGKDDFDPRFTHDIIGYNFKTMEFNAALGITQLEKADWIAKKRNENVKYLNEEMESFSDVLQLPPFSKNISYFAYPLIIKKTSKISRKKLRVELEKKGIESRPLFGSIPTQQPAYSFLKKQYKGKLPNAEFIGLNGFYIGCHQYLTQTDLDYLVKTFKHILK